MAGDVSEMTRGAHTESARLAILLQAVARDEPLSGMIRRGYTYTQIALLIESGISKGLITTVDRGLRVTPLGLSFIQEHSPAERAGRRWPIKPRPEHKLDNPNDPLLYIPPRRTLRRIQRVD